MSQLSGTSAAIEARITPHRSEVDKLLGVSRLLKRLEFLFELPGRLKRSIQIGDCEQVGSAEERTCGHDLWRMWALTRWHAVL